MNFLASNWNHKLFLPFEYLGNHKSGAYVTLHDERPGYITVVIPKQFPIDFKLTAKGIEVGENNYVEDVGKLIAYLQVSDLYTRIDDTYIHTYV